MKKNIKIFLSAILAFIMTFGAAGADKYGLFVKEVHAAGELGSESIFWYHPQQYMSLPGAELRTDRISTKRYNEVVVSWPSNQSGMANGVYLLEYAYRDGFVVNVYFTIGNEILVDYQRVLPGGAKTPLFTNYDSNAPANESVGGIRFFPTSEVAEKFKYNEFPAGTNGRLSFLDNSTVRYRIQNNGGFAFQIFDETLATVPETVKIRWENGRIYYSTDQCDPGPNIYPFTLKGARNGVSGNLANVYNYEGLKVDGSSTSTYFRSLAISTGYDLDAGSSDFKVAHKAKSYYNDIPGGELDGQMPSQPVLDYTKKGPRTGDLTPGLSPNTNYEESPATDCAVVLELTLPKKWNNYAFETVKPGDNVSFIVGGILKDGLNVNVGNVADAAQTSNGCTYTVQGDKGVITLIGLTESTIFNNVRLQLGHNDTVQSNDGTRNRFFGPYGPADGQFNIVLGDGKPFPEGSIYTYLKFSKPDLLDPSNVAVKIENPFNSFGSSGSIPGTYSIYVLSGRAGSPIGGPLQSVEIPPGSDLLVFPRVDQERYYRIEFVANSNGREVLSQTFKYNPVGLNVDTLETPRNFEIISSRTVTVADDSPAFAAAGGEQDYTRVKFSFQMGYNDVLIEMSKGSKKVKEIDYALSYGEGPKANTLWNILTLNVKLDPDYDANTPAHNSIVADGDIKLGASSISKGIQLISAEFTLDGTRNPRGVITAEVLIPAVPRTNLNKVQPYRYNSSDPYVLRYPNVYYASVQGSYYINSTSPPELQKTEISNESQLTVNDPAKFVVPVPSNLRAENDKTNAINVSWRVSASELYDYMDYILNPRRRTLSGIGFTDDNGDPTGTSIKYGIYISRDFESIKNPQNITAAPGGLVTAPDGIVTYKNTSGLTVTQAVVDIKDFKTDPAKAKEFLRNGGIYYLPNLEQLDFSPEDSYRTRAYFSFELSITGLDDNTPYYVVVQTQLEPYLTEWETGSIGVVHLDENLAASPTTFYPIIVGPDTDSAGQIVEPSGYTAVASATTGAGAGEISPDEYEPPAPTGLDKRDVTSTSSEVIWSVQKSSLPSNIESAGYRLEYQILRVKDVVLENSYKVGRKSMGDTSSEIIAQYRTETAGWQTVMQTQQIQVLVGPTGASAPDYKIVPDEEHVLTDDSLTPGTMYVYYIRTILVDASGGPLKYSIWVPVSTTTPPVNGPVNLRSLRTGNFDKMREAIISFDAPAQMTQIRNGNFKLELSIKSEDGDWGKETEMRTANLTGGDIEVDNLPGFYSYEYKITGLSPSTSYLFRVRIVDGVSGDKSMWSNTATYRTEFDPDVPEDPVPKWEDYFKQKLEELLKRPYWAITDKSGDSFEVVYRASMIDGVIGGAPDGAVLLGKDARSQIYYIPSQAFAKINAANSALKITAENVTAFIPPEVIEAGQTQALKDIIGQMNDGKIKDYYIMLSLSLERTGEKINGNDALTDRINFNVKTVGFEEMERLWDVEMEAELKILLNDATVLDNARNRLSKALANGYTNQEMVLLAESLAEDVAQDFAETVDRSFDDNRLYEYEAVSLAKPVRISAVPAQQTAGAVNITGYQWAQGGWQSLPTTPYGSGRSILPTSPGMFVFSGATVYIPGIENMPGGDAITNVVIKYGLDDFFGKGTSFSTSGLLTNDALVGAVARMAGANNTQDPAAFLRDKGVNVSVRNAYQPATNETTVYLLMSLYEIKTNTKIASIRVTNHNIIRDMPGINQNYVQHYKTAYQLGIMDRNYQPKEQMIVRDFLVIIGKLAGKIGL